MKPTIAKTESFCVCGAQIEIGDSIVMVAGSAVHVGCERKQQQPNGEQWREQFLFSDVQHEALNRAQAVVTNSTAIHFDGESVRPIDIPRLAGQVARVFELMRDSQWRTLKQIADACECLETSASARLRDLRKQRFGAHEVLSRQVSTAPLLYQYRVIVNESKNGTNSEQRAA
jgi:hypothetical protein